MRIRFTVVALVLTALLPLARAQIVETPAAVFGPPKAERFMGSVPAHLRPPAADPRDLNGNYVADLQSGGLGSVSRVDTAAGGAPAGAPAASAPNPPSLPVEATAQMHCVPEVQIGVSPYGGQIIQTPNRVTLITEYNHVVRRIYLDRELPQHIEPSYAGFSVGHWEGDTLVVETRGLKTAGLAGSPLMASITQVTERLRKIDAGRRVEDVAHVEGIDHDGRPVSASVRATMLWRPDVHLNEFICEDGAGRFFE